MHSLDSLTYLWVGCQHLLFFNLNLFIFTGGWLLYNIVLVLPYINTNPPLVCVPHPKHPSLL